MFEDYRFFRAWFLMTFSTNPVKFGIKIASVSVLKRPFLPFCDLNAPFSTLHCHEWDLETVDCTSRQACSVSFYTKEFCNSASLKLCRFTFIYSTWFVFFDRHQISFRNEIGKLRIAADSKQRNSDEQKMQYASQLARTNKHQVG